MRPRVQFKKEAQVNISFISLVPRLRPNVPDIPVTSEVTESEIQGSGDQQILQLPLVPQLRG